MIWNSVGAKPERGSTHLDWIWAIGGSWSGSGNDSGNALLGNQNVNFDAEI